MPSEETTRLRIEWFRVTAPNPPRPHASRLALSGSHRLSLLFTKSCPAFPIRKVRASPVQLRFSRSLRHLQELHGARIIPRQPSGDAPTHCGLLSEVFRRGRHIRPFERPDKSTLGANVRISICSILTRCCLATFNIEHPLTMRKVGCASKS